MQIFVATGWYAGSSIVIGAALDDPPERILHDE